MCFGNTIVEVSRRNAFKLQKELFVLSDGVKQNQRMRTNRRKYDRDVKRVEAEGLFNGVFEVNHNLPGIDKITEKINSVADIFANVHPQVAWKAILLSGLATFRLIYKHWGDYETCFLTFFNFVNSLGLPSLVYDYIEGVFTQAYDKLSELTTRKVKAHADDNSESSFDISPYLAILGGPIAVLLTALIVREIPGGDKPTEFLNRFSKIGSCVKTARDLHEVGAEFFNNIIEYVRVNVFGCDKRTIDEWASVNAWYAECMDIIPCFEEKLRADPTMKTKVDVLFERGLNIVKMLDMTKTPAARRDHVSKMMMTLAQFRDKASGVSAGQIALRVPPSIFHIFGDSGVGKSSILACLTADIQAALGVTDPKDINLLTYYRQPGRDFWDGYRNAVNLVVCDDFGAIVDSETRPNEEFLEAIRMSNTADYMLNMADLKDKGQTSFNAKAVIWTSNRSTFTCKSLTNYEAVIRRVAGKFRQRPAEGFYKIDIQNNKQVKILDTSKVAQKYGNLSIEAVCECIVFDEIDKVDGKIITEGMSYRQFSDKVVNSILSNKIYHEDFNILVTSYAEQAIQRAAQRRVVGHSDDDQHVNVSDISAPGADADVHALVWEGLDLSESNVSYRDMCFRTNKKEEAIRLWRDAHFTANLSNGTFEQKNKIFGTLLNSRPSVDFIKCNCAPDVGIAKIEHEMSKSFMSKCYTEIKEKFISWANFDTLVGLLKTVVSLGLFYGAGHLLGRLKNYFFPSARKVIQENYDTSKTRGRKVVVVEEKAPMSHRICDWCASFIPTGPYGSPACEHGNVKKLCFYCNPRLAEFYDNAKTVGVKQRNVEQCTCELYDTSKTDGVKRRSVELYDTSKTKGVKKINIEGCSGCGNCLKDSDDIGTPGYCNSTNYLKFAKVVPAQAVLDKNAADIVTKMCRNMYKLERQLEDGSWHHVINMLVIKGRLAITNRHVLGLRQHEKWRIVNTHKPDGYPLDLWTLNRSLIETGIHEKKDVMMFELPRVVEQHPDISDKFMDKCDFSRFTELKTVSLVGYVPQREIVLRQYFSDLIKAVDEPIEFVAPGYTSYCRQYFEYGIQSTPGDCGGVLVAFDKNFHNKIFGIHAGGDRSSAYCGLGTPITRDILKLLENNLKCYADSKMFPTITVDAEISAEPIDAGTHYDWKINLPFIGNFNFFGAVAKSVFASCDTAISPSPVYGVIAEPTMKPAHLKPFYSNGQRVDPMAKARIKASPAPVLLNKEILDSSVNHFTQLVLSDVCETDRRVLTYAEAIAGIHGDEYYAGLNRSTSPGYGWVKSGIGKQKWLGSGDEYDVTNQELIDAYNSIIAKCKLNRPSVLWQDTLKDERRPIAKVDAGKTRLFSVGEMSYTVAFRQYFLGFIAHMMRHKIDYESCVGVNCYSSDWSKIARKMQNVGKKVIAGDFGNYDGTLNAEMLWRVLDVIEQFYQGTEEEKHIRRALWSEVVNSLHINGNVIYGWTHSQPSGCPMTTILNCCYHSISARYVFLLCAMKHKPEFASLSNYTQYVRHINYGDDDVWNISDDIIEWFNQLSITEAYATIGMEYTDEAKTGNIVAYRSLNDINFLKRTFRWDNIQMRYRAPLALETVREMAMWNRKTSDVYSLTRDVLQDAVVELAQHSEDVFNAELPNFERARKIITKRAPCYFGTYNEYQNVEFAKYCVLDN